MMVSFALIIAPVRLVGIGCTVIQQRDAITANRGLSIRRGLFLEFSSSTNTSTGRWSQMAVVVAAAGVTDSGISPREFPIWASTEPERVRMVIRRQNLADILDIGVRM